MKSGILDFTSVITAFHKREYFIFIIFSISLAHYFPVSLFQTHIHSILPPNFGTSLISKLTLTGPISLLQTFSCIQYRRGRHLHRNERFYKLFSCPPKLMLFPQAYILPPPICKTIGHFSCVVFKVYNTLLRQRASKYLNHLLTFTSLSLPCPWRFLCC